MQPWKKVLSGFLAAGAMQPALVSGLNALYSLFALELREIEAEAAVLDSSELTEREKWLLYRLPEVRNLNTRRTGRSAQRKNLETKVVETEIAETKETADGTISEYLLPLSFDLEKLPKRVKHRYDQLTAEKNSYNLDTILDRVYQYQSIIEPLAEKYNIPSIILYAVALVESGSNASVNSNGLMQITPIAAKHLNNLQKENGNDVDCYKRRNADVNLECGTMLLRDYFDKFADKDLDRETHWLSAIAAYNRGKGGLKFDLERAGTTNPLDLKASQTTAEGYMYTAKVVAMIKVLENTSFFE
ncbi:transglycosylase SLT domain-containing protein [Candidatus Woesearchaeota archaeon]|nr:transglycosylase SLT domain-containing protein [Candidatus Woesearchaeota archaeon]